MPRHLVCVTFDFDTMYGLIARGLTTPNFVSRGEFGAVAVPRILALLRKYGIKATFFIPGFTIETYPAQSAAIVEAGHEIGHHGWTHLPPNDMSREQEEDGLMRANSVMENWLNDFAYLKENFDWGVLTYTFHPYVIGRGHRMMALEKLLRAVADGGAQFVTMEDAAREYDKRSAFSG